MLIESNSTYSGLTTAEQARQAWELAIALLIESGMSNTAARRAFGKILSQNKLTGDKLLPAVRACFESGTLDPLPYLMRAAAKEGTKHSDPGLMALWT